MPDACVLRVRRVPGGGQHGHCVDLLGRVRRGAEEVGGAGPGGELEIPARAD